MEVPPRPPARASIYKLPREIFSIYGGDETMYLLMTTYRQDTMTNFRCVRDKSTVFTVFYPFSPIHKRTCQPFKVFMLKIKNDTKFSVILIVRN